MLCSNWLLCKTKKRAYNETKPLNSHFLHRRCFTELLEPRLCLSGGEIHGFKWNDMNDNGYRECLIAGDNPDVVFVVDVSLSTNRPFGTFGHVSSTIFNAGDNWMHGGITGGSLYTPNKPVVIASPASYNDNSPAIVRIKDLTSERGFNFIVDEWGDSSGGHANETVVFYSGSAVASPSLLILCQRLSLRRHDPYGLSVVALQVSFQHAGRIHRQAYDFHMRAGCHVGIVRVDVGSILLSLL